MHEQEVLLGDRFEFGKNWARFLSVVDDRRMTEMEKSLKRMLEVEDLEGKRFLDIGSGSGLSSLAAFRLGATVHSFDYDPKSVACTTEMRRRSCANDPAWTIEQGSALDTAYMESLGEFDIVYSWGVLHHTGELWKALSNAAISVRDGGKLLVSIYNDQGRWSDWWLWIKRTYNKLPPPLRLVFAALVLGLRELKFAIGCLIKCDLDTFLQSWTAYQTNRGMSRWHDLIDWIGGYPFEVARPEAVVDFYVGEGFILRRMKLCGGGSGCNEFVFIKERCTNK